MRKEDLSLGMDVVLRTKIIGKVSYFSDRTVGVDIGSKIISVHHKDILEKYNNGGQRK